MHHDNQKNVHRLSHMTIDYSFLDATHEDKQHDILNAVTKMEISDSKHFLRKNTKKSQSIKEKPCEKEWAAVF